MEVSKSAYYAWTKIPKLTHKAIENEKLHSKTIQLLKKISLFLDQGVYLMN